MHCVFSYDLSVPSGSRREEIVNNINELINTHRNVRRLTTFYILYVQDNNDWERLRVRIANYATSIQETLHFIMTPPIRGGRYDGILARGEWEDINTIAAM